MYSPAVFLLFFIFNIFAQDCPKISSIHGEPGDEVKSEIDCALQCKIKWNCFGYLYKNHNEFLTGPNSYQSNCVLQTVWDKNILAELVLSPNEYNISKVKVSQS